MKRIFIVTSTRADWGLLAPIARKLDETPDVELVVCATNMHLDPQRGHTIDEIRAEGLKAEIQAVDVVAKGDTNYEAATKTAEFTAAFAKVFEERRPSLVVLLGDRYEILAAALSAYIMRIPIAHIAGGEVTRGALDDNIRHCITKLASLHFPSTKEYADRIIAMGEDPTAVHNVGAMGVYNMLHTKLLSADELAASLGFHIKPGTLLVTFHPATIDKVPPSKRFADLLEALDQFPDNELIITAPNNDPGSEDILLMVEDYARRNPERVHYVPSLGHLRYLSVLQYVAAVVGNSSSGIVEVPSAHIPTVNIGVRQLGRIAGPSVIHCHDDAASIADAIHHALSPDMQAFARCSANPYEQPDTLRRIVQEILKF